MDAVRRDILGDEELERICMKIYKKHKRALDLIINCKNDLIPRINEHCKEWARRKAKADEIVFDEGGLWQAHNEIQDQTHVADSARW